MPTTANFSLEYPDDNSSVDIAGHFETLADDVDEAINTRLALTGGTLTGSLSGTSLSLSSTLSVAGTTTFTGNVISNVTIAKASPTLMVSASSGESRLDISGTSASNRTLRFRTAGVARWTMFGADGTAESGSNAGSNFVLASYDDAGSYIATPLSITRSTGAVTLTGDLTVNKASPVLSIRTAAIDQAATLEFREGTAQRWSWVKDGAAAEDLTLYRSTDGSAVNGVVQFKRDTGNALFTGDLTISKASATQTISSSSGNTSLLLDAVAGNTAMQYFRTGTSVRWAVGRGGGSESGSNANSNFYISGYSDAGALLGDYLTITRSTGAITLTGDLTISKASATHTTSSSSGTTNVNLDSVAGTYKYLNFRTGTSARWTLGTTATAESGSNAGTDLFIGRSSDGGAYIDAPLTITRSTGAVTLTGTLNGKVVNDLVTGPASATDNALVRFDNTTGKVVQNSGITVDDSGNVTTDLTISKSAASLNLDAVAGSATNFRWRAGGTNRWAFIRNWVAESGSNAGSNFQMYKYTDGGTGSVNVEVTRSTGRWTFNDVGASAGLELGTSGPRVMSGTGSPEGVVTAPIGSIWFQSDSTVGVTHWKKASGSGNTGWVVMEGDTGNRNISADLLVANGFTGVYAMNIRRVGNTVMLMASQLLRASTGAGNFYTIPLGFRPDMTAAYGKSFSNNGCYASGSAAYITMGTSDAGLSFTYTTNDAWPTSLPGSAA